MTNWEIEPLKVLADVVAPLEFYGWHGSREYTQFTPLNRLADAVPCESHMARAYSEMVACLVDDSEHRANDEMMLAWLMMWRDIHAALQPALEVSSFYSRLRQPPGDPTRPAIQYFHRIWPGSGRHRTGYSPPVLPLLLLPSDLGDTQLGTLSATALCASRQLYARSTPTTPAGGQANAPLGYHGAWLRLCALFASAPIFQRHRSGRCRPRRYAPSASYTLAPLL